MNCEQCGKSTNSSIKCDACYRHEATLLSQIVQLPELDTMTSWIEDGIGEPNFTGYLNRNECKDLAEYLRQRMREKK